MGDHIIYIIQVSYWVQKPKSLELMNLEKKKGTSQYQKLRIHKKILKNIWIVYIFLPNIILTWFCKELTKYKNDYKSIVFKLYI